jgi:putative DNA primase/helicase
MRTFAVGFDVWKSSTSVARPKKKLDQFKVEGLPGKFGGILELENEPPVNWLIPGWLAARELTAVYGKGGTLKSYIALGWSLQLAAWENRKVLYVAAEGTSGLRSRVDAWRAKHNEMNNPLKNWHYYNANVFVDQEEQLQAWAFGLAKYLKNTKDPELDLVIIDTLARNFLGDENSAKEMGMFVEGCESIRRSLNTAVLVIHHEGVTTGRDRGSPALRNATFAMFRTSNPRVADKGASVQFESDRMKDAKEPDEVRLHFDLIDLDVDAMGEVFQSSLAMKKFPPQKHAVKRKRKVRKG